MDYLNHPNSKVHTHLLSHSSKRMKTSIKFLLCFSLLFVLFSSFPLLLQLVKPFLMNFFSYMVEKSYMFLICNGLLVLIAMNSGPVHSSSPSTTYQSIQQHTVVVHEDENIKLDSKESDTAVAAPIAGEEFECPQEEKILENVKQENVVSSDSQEEEEEGNALAIIEEDEHGVYDTEELNKKCEDFIKRMKATFSSKNLELRAVDSFYFTNQQSLVAVVN